VSRTISLASLPATCSVRVAEPVGAQFPAHGALDGGGTLSLKTDAQGKVFSTALLRLVIDVPDSEARTLGLPAA
jgi:hypothetical protein